MPLDIVAFLGSKLLAGRRLARYVIAIIVVATIRAYCQGRTTTRDRDLHARTILLTGGFTPLGLTILENLAQRGAHIIALAPDPIDTPQISLVVDALRTSTSNERIFAEHCDLSSAIAVRQFCLKFLKEQEKRIDAVIFAHEYEHTGSLLGGQDKEKDEKKREAGSLSTFLITTLLLPALLVAPAERDIRIINVVNSFYAAAIPSFASSLTEVPKSTLPREGYRSLRTSILTRHLQRILDALPAAPPPDPNTTAVPLASMKGQKSNIVAVSVTPGISRTDTIAPMLRANVNTPDFSILGFLLYLILQPLLRILTKSPYYAVQTVLHVLFLPTPFKRAPISYDQNTGRADKNDPDVPIEVLKPGAFYSNCAVIPLNIPYAPKTVKSKLPDQNGKEKSESENDVVLEDDGEMGGEALGRAVWENFEIQLKAWEDSANEQAEAVESHATILKTTQATTGSNKLKEE